LRAAGFRRLCAELGANPAVFAHRYALSLDIDTLVLGLRTPELAECVAAAEGGPLPADLVARVDASLNGHRTLLPEACLDRDRHEHSVAPVAKR
jgi:aryl-alcohol dehydrogenase-like predicted oxidoreductase